MALEEVVRDNLFKPLRFEQLSVSENANIKKNGKEVKLTDLKPRTGVLLELEASELVFVVVGIETIGKEKPRADTGGGKVGAKTRRPEKLPSE